MTWYYFPIWTFCLAISFCSIMKWIETNYEKNKYKEEYENLCIENDRYKDIIAKYARNEAVLIDRIKDLRKKCGQLNTKEDTNNFIKNGTNYVPKGTIKYIRLAMKYTHPDAGGSDEDFIKCNNIYKELKEKYKEI